MNAIIKNNLYELYKDILAAENAKGGMICQFKYIFHPSSPWPNMIYLENEQKTAFGEKNIDFLIDQINLNKCPRVLILDDQNADSEFKDELRNKSFLPAAQWVNMGIDLVSAKSTNSETEGFIIKVIDNDSASNLREWISIPEMVLFNKQNIDQHIFKSGTGKKFFYLLLGYFDNIPVCTTLLYCGTCAGVYMVATLPSHRRMGLSAKMMNATQQLAKSLGHNFIALHSTKEGLPLYNSLGYKFYGKMSLYYYLSK